MSLIGNNSLIPGEPEYGKPWKPENNYGCACRVQIASTAVCKTLVQHFTRFLTDAPVETLDCGCPAPVTTPACPPPPINSCPPL